MVMKRMGQSGQATRSSLPGGVFGLPSEPQQRARLDGVAGGRANSSSVAGGIFGSDEDCRPTVKLSADHHPSRSSIEGGIFGLAGDGDFKGGGYGNGYAKSSASAWEGAAGGKSSNAGQVRDGHFRAGTVGNNGYAQRIGGGSGMLPTGGRGGQVSARPSHNPNFLDQLAAAEQRDAEEAHLLAQLEEEGLDHPPSEREMIAAAAEQIAEERGLDAMAQQRLEEELWARHQRSQGFFSAPTEPQPPTKVSNSLRAAGGRSTNAHMQHRMVLEPSGQYRPNANTSSIAGGIFG